MAQFVSFSYSYGHKSVIFWSIFKIRESGESGVSFWSVIISKLILKQFPPLGLHTLDGYCKVPRVFSCWYYGLPLSSLVVGLNGKQIIRCNIFLAFLAPFSRNFWLLRNIYGLTLNARSVIFCEMNEVHFVYFWKMFKNYLLFDYLSV